MRLTNKNGFNLKDQLYFEKFNNRSYASHKKSTCISWNPSGNLLACADSNLRIYSFDHQLGLELTNESNRRDPDLKEINDVIFYEENCVIGGNRECLRVWDVRNNMKTIKSEKKNKSDILTFTWNHNSGTPHFATLSKDNVISVFDLRKMSSMADPVSTDKNKNELADLAYDYSGNVLFCVGSDSGSSSSTGVITAYSKDLQPLPDILSPHTQKINSIAVSPTNLHMATCSDDSLTILYSLPEIICERSYSHTDCNIKKVSFSHDGQYLASCCDEPKVELASNKGEESRVKLTPEPCIDFYNTKTGGHAFRIKCGTSQQVMEWNPTRNILAYVDITEDDRKEGHEKEERLIHLFGL